MNERSLKWLYDALMAAEAIQRFCRDTNFDEYRSDDLLASAVERKFEVIGEALARIRNHHPNDLAIVGEWPSIIGFRNLLAHAYDRVDDAVVWGIVSRQIPEFIQALRGIPELNALDSGDPKGH